MKFDPLFEPSTRVTETLSYLKVPDVATPAFNPSVTYVVVLVAMKVISSCADALTLLSNVILKELAEVPILICPALIVPEKASYLRTYFLPTIVAKPCAAPPPAVDPSPVRTICPELVDNDALPTAVQLSVFDEK